MASVNKAIIVGNLGQDPDVRYTPGGQAVANFSIATTEKWTNKQTGNLDEKTEWHRIVVWGKLAELCREYLHKGRSVYIEGRIQTRNWDDKDGNKRYTTEIVASQMQFLGRRDESHTPAPASQGQTTQTTQTTSQESGPPPFDSEDDIPF